MIFGEATCVHMDHATFAFRDKTLNHVSALRIEAGRQAKGYVVGDAQGLIHIIIGNHGKDWAKNLVTGDFHIAGHVRQNGWRVEIPACVHLELFTTRSDRGTGSLCTGNKAIHILKLLQTGEWSDFCSIRCAVHWLHGLSAL